MEIKKIVVFSLLLLLFSFPVYAEECSVTEKTNLKKKAGYIDIVYYPYNEGNEVKFNLIISNASDFEIESDIHGLNQTTGENDEVRITNLNPGQTYKFYFYATDLNCYGTEIYNKTVTLPSYNKFYNDPVCNGKEEFYLCNKWKEHNLTYEEFVKKVSEYEKKTTDVITVKEEKEDDFWSILADIYLKYYYAILIPIIIVLIIVIIILRKKDDLIK